MSRFREILPRLPVVFGLPEPEAAASVGLSASKFRELVADGRMPQPRRIDGKLPHNSDTEADSWADLA